METIKFGKSKEYSITIIIDGNKTKIPVNKTKADYNLRQVILHPKKYQNPEKLAEFYESLLANAK